MASITKRGKTWRAQVRKGGVSLSDSFPTKAQATAWAAKAEAEIEAKRLGHVPDKTFGDLLSRYRDEITPQKRGHRWEAVRITRFVRDEELASAALSDLSPVLFAEWRDRRLKEVSAASVLRELNLLSSACTIATREWQWLTQNPVKAITRPAEPKSRKRRPVGDELEKILYALGCVKDEIPEKKTALTGIAALFAIETAMRAGEICGLTWPNVDLNRRVAHLPTTKNGHARDVPLSKEAIRLLELLTKDTKRVFDITPASLSVLWRKGCARVFVDDLHFHDLRREALTRMARKVDVLTLAKISGHRDLRILSNTYYAPDMADVASQLD